MSTFHFPAPDIAPLKRLHVYDSLMMNAQRWLLAHDYHRQRQNVHYQSLNQPGIVCGLGVTLIDPPDSTDSRFRDRSWFEIQPGIAIDVEGNVIVVDETINRTYRLAARPPKTGSITVYVVVSYVEPQAPGYPPHPEILQEQCRFDQKTTPPDAHEIELCRIQLSADFAQLELPDNVFFPRPNQLDVSHRLQAQAKPLVTVQAAQVSPQAIQPQETGHPLTYLARSAPALYPALHSVAAPEVVPLQAEAIAPYDLLLLDAAHLSDLNGQEQDGLQDYLTQGGVLLIELPLHQKAAIDNLREWIAHVWHTSLAPWYTLPNDHPLRSHPFLFAAPPDIDQDLIHVWSGGGIVLVAGGLSAAWTPESQEGRSRNDIRTAQEFGMNLLHFAWRRRHLTRLLQPALGGDRPHRPSHL